MIYVRPINSNIEGIDIYFFRVLLKPQLAYLLSSQKKDIIVVGKQNKDMFDEMKELYDFLICSEEEKLNFLEFIS